MRVQEILQAEISQLVNDRDTLINISSKQENKDLYVGEKENFAIEILQKLLLKIKENDDNNCG